MSQRKRLFLLVFVWSCLCLVIFKSLFLVGGPEEAAANQLVSGGEPPPPPPPPVKLRAREASSERPSGDNTHTLVIDNSLISDLSGANQSSNPYYYQVHEQAANNNKVVTSISKISASSSSAAAASASASSQKPDVEHRTQHKQAPVAGSQCAYEYPNLEDLKFNNLHWQRLTTASKANTSNPHVDHHQATYYLYNAYYDDRRRAATPSVRVLAMIDRVKPPPTNCVLWYSASSSVSTPETQTHKPRAVVSRASFVYAWYPKWGNYEDGLLQPWIVTCPVAAGVVPDSVSLVGVPGELLSDSDDDVNRKKRSYADSIAMPPQFSSSSSSSSPQDNSAAEQSPISGASSTTPSGFVDTTQPMRTIEYDCKSVEMVTNNLVVTNKRPPVGQKRDKFAVCVKGLDFPHDDVSVRLVEWIELLHLLGAKKIFLYELSVHENISKVLRYYQRRGLVELSPLTLPGDQPNNELQHVYLKQKLTAKRQNELIPYNDCLYRNLHSFEYLALLDIDEIIMPLRSQFNQLEELTSWYDLMAQVEFSAHTPEQNYSRASYNVRNVYFFDDLSGPLGTTPGSDSPQPSVSPASEAEVERQQERNESLERGVPHYLHMMSHVYRSKNYTEPGQYVKCFHNTDRVVSLHNHFPMNCFGQCTTYSIPVNMAHLQHYRKDCVGPLRQSCKNDFRHFTTRDTTIWRYKQRMIRRTTRVLNHLGLLATINEKAQAA